MLMRIAVAIAVALNVIWASDVWASCRRVILPEGVGTPVFKHYVTDGGQAVDVVINNDLVRFYRAAGGKAKVRKLQIDKMRKAGWVPKEILSRQHVSCTMHRLGSESRG
jgi:hypothetical protein